MNEPLNPLVFEPSPGDLDSLNIEIPQQSSSDLTISLPINYYKLNLPILKPYRYPDRKPNPTSLIEKARNNVFDTLELSHFYWDYPLPHIVNDQNYYKFELPSTNFQEENQINYINLPEYKFHSDREKLNSTQLKEVWNSRTFKVPSEMENLPHLWSISSWLLHSSKERTNFFKKTLASCLRLFYAIPNVVNPFSNRVIRINLIESLARPNIFNVFINFVAFFLNIFDFFFGFKFRVLQENYEILAEKNVIKKALLQLCKDKEIFPETYQLSELSLIQNTDKNNHLKDTLIFKQKLQEIAQNFDKKFAKEMMEELNKEDYEEEEIKSISFAIGETKQEKLLEYLEEMIKNKNAPIILSSVMKKIKAFNIFQTLSIEKNKKIQNERKNIAEKIERDHSIFFLIGYKRERLIQAKLTPIEESIEKEFQIKFENELKSENLNEEIALLKRFIAFEKEKPKLIEDEIKEMRKYCLSPVNKFTIKYPLFPSQYRKEKRSMNWYLITEDFVTINSDFPFYKVVKALASYIIKLYSLMFKILKFIWEGPFGIKCLFLYSEFYTKYSINDQGVVQKNVRKIRPVLRCFVGVIHGIQKSRKWFEEAPDDGFFGKNFGRILNILYCFFVRFLFAGVLIILIIYPLMCLMCIFGGVIAAITTLIWLVFVEVFLLIWKFLVYDYKSTLRHHSWAYYDKTIKFYEHPHLKLLRSYKWFTLLHLSFDFLVNVIGQLIMVVIMIIFAPLISIFVFFAGILLYILKCIWDWLILNIIIRCFARVPSRNSTFAYRISGPGISRDFYNTLETKDLSLLIIAHLERLELDHLLIEGNQIIEHPKKIADEKCKSLFYKFMKDNKDNLYFNDSFKNIEFLKKSLIYYINKRKTYLPTISGGHHTIRFTSEELEKNEQLVEEILKEFIKEKNMDRYIWSLYGLREGLYKRLTRNILMQILCKEAINPVEEIDHIERVKFAQNHVKINSYITKFIYEENENYKKKQKKQGYLQKKNQKFVEEKIKEYVSVNDILGFYSQYSENYNRPFSYQIIEPKSIIHWNNINKKKPIDDKLFELRMAMV